MVDRTTMSRLVLGMWVSLLFFLLQNNTPVLYGCCKEGNSIHTLTSAKAMKRKKKKKKLTLGNISDLECFYQFSGSEKCLLQHLWKEKQQTVQKHCSAYSSSIHLSYNQSWGGKKGGSDLYKHAWYLICTAGNRRRKQMLQNKYAQHNWSHCLVATRAQNLRFTESSNTDFPNVLDTHQKYACPYTPVLFLPHKNSFT